MLTLSAIVDRNNVISPTEMHNEIFQKEKKIMIFLETIEGMADKSNMHFLTFNLLVSILFVKVMVLKRGKSLLRYHLIIKIC